MASREVLQRQQVTAGGRVAMEPAPAECWFSITAAASCYPIVAHQTAGRRSRLLRVVAAPLVVAFTRARPRFVAIVIGGAFCVISPAAWAATFTGKTSQHGVVRVDVGKRDRLTGLVIQLKTSCTDHKRRAIWPAFQAPFRDAQDAPGNVSDSYNIVGRNAVTGARFRQRASFSARISRRTVKGSATATQTLIGKGVVCKSPRVSFTART
jgi:hypothetical protein